MKGKQQVPKALTGQDGCKPSKSPQRKLVKFFAQSRDQWKEKCRAAKATLKQCKKKLQRVEERQQRRQSRVRALEGELARVQAEKRALEEAVAAGEKKDC